MLELGKHAQQVENLSWVDIDEVIKKLEGSLKTPCHLIFQKSVDDDNDKKSADDVNEKKNDNVL